VTNEHNMDPNRPQFNRWLFVILALALLSLLFGGGWRYHLQEKAMRQEVEKDLTAIAQLKADRISSWRNDQLADASVEAHSKSLETPIIKHEEAFADWRFQWVLLGVLLIGGLCLLGGFGLVIWLRAKKAHFQALYNAEATLRAQAERHSIILKAIGDAVIATDAQGRVELLNPVAEALTGWRQEEARGRALREIFRIVDAHSREPSQDPVAQVLREDRVVGLANHTLLIARDGTEYQIADSAAPIRDPGGAVSGVVLVFRDVTESYRMRQDLETRETRYRELVESTAAIGWEYDIGADRWTYVAPQVESILGWLPADWTNLAFWIDNLHPDDRDTAYSQCMACTTKGENHQLEYRFRSKGGNYVWMRDVVVVEREGNEPARLRGILIDITERKQVEETLREASLRLREAVHAANIGLWDWDLATNKVRYSAEWKQQIGYEEDEIGEGFEEWERRVHPDDLPATIGRIRKAVARRDKLFRVEFRFRHKNGSYRWMLAQSSVFNDEAGDPTRVLGSHIDITDRKYAEEELQKRESLLNKIFDVLPIGLWFADQNGKLQRGNPAGIKIWGAEPKVPIEEYGVFKARRLPSGEIVSPEDWALARTVKRGVTVIDELLEIDAFDGKKKIIFNSTAPVLDDCGKLLGAIVVNTDITNHQQIEAERARLMFAVEQAAEVFVITDVEGHIQYVNPAFERSTGYTAEEALGQNPRILKSGEQDKAFYDHLWLTILAGGTWRGRMTNKRKDGTFYVEEAVISPVLDTTGRIVNFVAVKRDISAEIRMEERLRQAQKMEAIGTLAGGIAHDFNNILFPIIGMSELLLEDLPPDGPEYDNVREILTAGKRGSQLVKQILAFSRQSEDKKIPIRLQPIIKEVVKLVRATIPSNIAIAERIQPDCGLVMANATQVHQIAMNLITNAFHAVEATGGRIAIQLAEIAAEGQEGMCRSLEPGRYARLTVSDTGNGIDPAAKDKIFEPYFTTKEQGKGTGLGLSTVYGIVKQHKGEVTVYSEVGEGATFNVYLPLMTRAGAPRTLEPLEKIPSGSERILLVDDEAAIVWLERQMLERLGYRVTSRVSSLEALEAFKAASDAYDLVITDMTMPNMTGDSLAKAIKAIRADIPVIICTGFSERIDPAAAADMGIRAFLMKPVAKMELARVVRSVLDGGGPAH